MRIGLGQTEVCDATGVCLDTSSLPIAAAPPIVSGSATETAALNQLPVTSPGLLTEETTVNQTPVLTTTQAEALPNITGTQWIWIGGAFLAFILLLTVVKK